MIATRMAESAQLYHLKTFNQLLWTICIINIINTRYRKCIN